METSLSNKVLELANKYLGEFEITNGQVSPEVCPFCHGGDHHDTHTFYVGLYNGAFKCHRGSCNKEGSFRDLCNHFGVDFKGVDVSAFPTAAPKKQYALPDPMDDEIFPLSDGCADYLKWRGISRETAEAFGVGTSINGDIAFPCYRDGKLIHVKYRKPSVWNKGCGFPKEWGSRGTEPILFGMDNVSFNKPLYITEGLLDAMALYEAGITNVVSVPNGCNNLDFVTLCWDWLEKFQQIVLFGDSDEPGIDMVHTLMKRLGEDRCLIAKDYPNAIKKGEDLGYRCKDACSILSCYGKEFLHDFAMKCEPAPVKGILNLADVTFVDPMTVPRIMTKIKDLDNCINGLVEGGITVFSGKRGEGKSTLAGQLLLNAVQAGESVCAYSGELSAQNFLNWIMLQATERKYLQARTDSRSGKAFAVVPYAVQERIRAWLSGKFFLYDNNATEDEDEGEAILRVFTMCARRYGCKLFLVDNLMTVVSGQEEELRAQTRFATALKKFAVRYKCHVLLIAHPRKQKPGELFTNDSVSGSANITNVADNVINVEKPNLRVTKNREFGKTCYIECCYDPSNRRVFQSSVGDFIQYGWDHKDLDLPLNGVDSIPEFAIQRGEPQTQSAPF